MRKLLIFAFAALTFAGSASAKPANLTAFKGTYSGLVNYTNQDGPISASGNVTATFSCDKKGRNGTFVLSGIVSAGGSSAPLNETISFSGRTITVSDFAPFIVTTPFPVTGSYTLNKKGTSLTASIPWTFSGATGTSSFTLSVKPGKRTHTFNASLILGVNGGSQNFMTINWTGVGKIKKK